MQEAFNVLKEKFENVKIENDYIKIYDIEETEDVVDYLFKKNHIVREIKKNKIGLEEYYIEIMAQKEVK